MRQDPKHTADLVELHYLKPIAAAIYRYRTRRDDADFDRDLTAQDKTALIREAAAAVRRNDVRHTRAATYFAADCVTPKGLGSLRRDIRATVVACLEVAISAFDQALADQAPPAAIALMAKLAEADRNPTIELEHMAPVGAGRN